MKKQNDSTGREGRKKVKKEGVLQALLGTLGHLKQSHDISIDKISMAENRILETLRKDNCRIGYNEDEVWENPYDRYERSEFQIEHPECHISGGKIYWTLYDIGSTSMAVKSYLKFVSPEEGKVIFNPIHARQGCLESHLHWLAKEWATYKCKLTIDYDDKFKGRKRKRLY